MQQMKDLLRSSLRTSLGSLSPVDRLAATWPVVAGHAIAERSTVSRLDGTVATVVVSGNAGWVQQLRTMTPQLRGELAKVSGIPLTDILFLAADSQRSARREPAKDARP